MAKLSSKTSEFIIPTILLLFGVVMFIVYLKARKQQKKAEELGLLGKKDEGNTGNTNSPGYATNYTGSDGKKYTFLSEEYLKNLTTINV